MPFAGHVFNMWGEGGFRSVPSMQVRYVMASVNFYNKIIGKAPELCGVGDPENLVAVHVLDDIGTGGLVCHHFSFVGIEVNYGKIALVGRCEEVLVEIAFHEFGLAEEASLDNLALLQLALAADCIIAGVKFVGEFGAFTAKAVLGGRDGVDGCTQGVYSGVEFANHTPRFVEVGTEGCDFSGLTVNLFA